MAIPAEVYWAKSRLPSLKKADSGDFGVSGTYDYVIVDSSVTTNPFDRKHWDPFEDMCQTTFKDYINEASVIIPYQPYNSWLNNLRSTLEKLGENNPLLGIFISNFDRGLFSGKRGVDKNFLEKTLKEIHDFSGEKMIDIEINYDIAEMASVTLTTEKAFAAKNRVISSYENLTSEITNRLAADPRTRKKAQTS